MVLLVVPPPKTMRHQTFTEGRHLNKLVSLLPMLLPGPDLILEVQIVIPLGEVMNALGTSDDQSPDGIGLVGVVAANSVACVVV